MSFTAVQAQLIPRKPAPEATPAAPSRTPSSGLVPAPPAGPAVPPPAVTPGRPLKDEDAEKLVRQLAEIQASLQGKRSSYNNSLLSQLKEAGNSEEKAFQLWLDATKEFDFDEQGKTATEFAEWKRTKGKELHNPRFMTGLRLQARYLSVLIIYGNAETDDLPKADAIAAAAAYLEDLTASARKLEGRLDELNGNVLDSVIARHLKLDASLPKSKNEASRPGNIREIYERAILPYYREKGQTAALLAAWQKLISQETAMVEAAKIPEKTETFNRERLPVLKWGMAREMYNAGQEDTGMASMLGLIKANLANKQAEGWIGEMGELLRSRKERAAAALAPAPRNPDRPAASAGTGSGLVPAPPALPAADSAPASSSGSGEVLNPFENPGTDGIPVPPSPAAGTSAPRSSAGPDGKTPPARRAS